LNFQAIRIITFRDHGRSFSFGDISIFSRRASPCRGSNSRSKSTQRCLPPRGKSAAFQEVSGRETAPVTLLAESRAQCKLHRQSDFLGRRIFIRIFSSVGSLFLTPASTAIIITRTSMYTKPGKAALQLFAQVFLVQGCVYNSPIVLF
jgi:hypothetical protein